jgi:PBP superfamily domain
MEGVIELGVCRNLHCSKAASGEQIERYPGPGEFCPECGERLEPIPLAIRDSVRPDVYESLQERMYETFVLPARDARKRTFIIIVAIVIALLVVAGMVFFHPIALGLRAIAGTRVCTSSGSDALAANIVRAYAAKSSGRIASYRVDSGDMRGCDVRFWTTRRGGGDALIARDAVVAVVHPQNRLARLSERQLRRIFNGSITDWAQLGEPPGRITALLPDDRSDELRALGSSLFRGVKIDRRVRRDLSSAAIVRKVASASGRRLIGFVTFSAAVPAKVLAVGSAIPPSTLSIADHRYPYTFDVMVASGGDASSAKAVDLIRFARSDAAQGVVAHAGFIAKRGI